MEKCDSLEKEADRGQLKTFAVWGKVLHFLEHRTNNIWSNCILKYKDAVLPSLRSAVDVGKARSKKKKTSFLVSISFQLNC